MLITHNHTRQDKTRQDKTRQDKTRQDKTRQDKTRQDKTRQTNYGFVTPSLVNTFDKLSIDTECNRSVKRQKISPLFFGINPQFLPKTFFALDTFGISCQTNGGCQ